MRDSQSYSQAGALGDARQRLDAARIAQFGLSGGGSNVSFAACAESATVHHAVAVAPGNLDAHLTPEMLAQNKPLFEIIALHQNLIVASMP